MTVVLGILQHIHQKGDGADFRVIKRRVHSLFEALSSPGLPKAGFEHGFGQGLEPDLAEAPVENAALVIAVAVGVGPGEGRKNALQRSWISRGNQAGHERKIGRAEHRDVAVAPALLGYPFECLADVIDGRCAEIAERASGSSGSANVEQDLRVAAAGIEVRIATYHMAARM